MIEILGNRDSFLLNHFELLLRKLFVDEENNGVEKKSITGSENIFRVDLVVDGILGQQFVKGINVHFVYVIHFFKL